MILKAQIVTPSIETSLFLSISLISFLTLKVMLHELSKTRSSTSIFSPLTIFMTLSADMYGNVRQISVMS